MGLFPKRLVIVFLIALFSFGARHSVSVHAGTIKVLMDSTDYGLGYYIHYFKAPALNDAGTVGLMASSSGSGSYWLATYSDEGSFSVSLSSHGIGFNDKIILGLSSLTGQRVALSNSGHTAAVVSVSRPRIGGVFVNRAGTPSSQVAIREGSYELTTSEAVDFTPLPFRVPSLNDNGEIGFIANLVSMSSSLGYAIYKQGDELQEIMRIGDVAPHNGGVILELTPPALSDTGRAAYLATVENPDGSKGGTLYTFDGTEYVEIASSGIDVPGGNGYFTFEGSISDGFHGFDFPGINDADQLGFAARITGTNGGEDEYGIYLGNENELIELARTGDVSSKGAVINGEEISRTQRMGSRGVSNSGKVLFHSTYDADNRELGYGYFVADLASGDIIEIARDGQLLEKGGRLSLSTFDTTINDSGEVAFSAFAGSERGIFFVKSDGTLHEIIRAGDSFQDSTITQLSFSTQINETGNETSGFNNLGQIAFQYVLENGVSGIALFTPVPEPSAMSIVLVLTVGCSIRRRSV